MCGVEALDEYLRRFAEQPRRRGIGSGFGKLLLGCAVDRCLKARQQVAAYALLVDAKDEVAKAYDVHFGFKTFPDAPLTLYLPSGRWCGAVPKQTLSNGYGWLASAGGAACIGDRHCLQLPRGRRAILLQGLVREA